MPTTEHAVVIVGAGPAGMMLGAELALAGVEVGIVERRPDHVLAGSRGGGLHSRTIELLDQRGVADRFLAEGQTAQVATFGTTVLDMSDFPTPHPYSLALFQNRIEQIMAEWIAELPVRLYHGRDVTGFRQDEDGIDVSLSDGEALRARYLVGCDGGRSMIRKAAGIDFPGWDATRSNLIAEVEVAEEPPKGPRHDAAGVHGLHRMEDGSTVRVVVTERQLRLDGEPTLVDLSEALVQVFGTDFGIHSPTWISRFTDATRQAASYRDRRVLLAGDAAHIHYPAGGQGISMGIQDAVNLGWKLAQVHDARPVLLNLGRPGGLEITPWIDRVSLVDAAFDGGWELPVIGTVSASGAVLIRPDGYVAWIGDGGDTGLTDALEHWFGAP